MITEPSPEDIMSRLDAVLVNLRNARSPLSICEQNKLAGELTDVYNYLSGAMRKPSLWKAITAQASARHAVQRQLELEQKNLESHKKFVEGTLERADQYFRAVQMGGYAAFFGLWALTKSFIEPRWAAFAALLMLFSASLFVVWEVAKATILGLVLKNDAKLAGSRLEEFISRRAKQTLSKLAQPTMLAQWRSTFWILSVVPAFVAMIILGWHLGAYLVSQI